MSNSDIAPLLQSILITSPDSTDDVYGGVENIIQGLKIIVAQLGNGENDKDSEQTRYIVSMLSMERKVAKKPAAFAQLAERIEQLDRQLEHFDITDDTIVSAMASIYSDVISPIGPKIQIAGSPNILQQKSQQHRVRAVLLAGIRSAVLWRQLGGKRRQIVFNRSQIVREAQQLLNNYSS